MSASDTSGFGKFIPGFEFLQSLSKGASGMPQMPNLANWVAPTLNVEDLEKRIEELKHVQFWLEQNARALSATIQAMEVQKMTLATLKGMNFNLADVANALKPRAPSAAAAAPAAKPAPQPQPQAQAEADADDAPQDPAEKAAPKGKAGADAAAKAAAAGMVDPIKLWGSLTQQFQQIAATAVRDAAHQAAANAAAVKATAAKAADSKAAAPKKTGAAKAAAKKSTARSASPAKAAARKSATK